MPTYSYRCPDCSDFDLVRPMAEADAPARCPGCGRPSRRVFGAPALHSMDPRQRRAMDASERSADAPEVVSSVPGRARQAIPVTRDPRHARLPRP
ncbi:FmdB family zinc ribbon protein [Pseudonocardia asaccharolytica]|uniref:Putative regulatory protein FmdB zinc ribbon domain-containing protein n=1 Tax=Pseudonocardia asaccharolytica DSM 44247 = NBRC 16224 TaxID=1123024 RepID=A0A511D5Z1_9PSEU|nr:zinc ribbon domain-containing protein [Pseudonocardia asaccharolytica]GEL20195.1 hypothetical protein PA7_40320 [Pseudonocardia asaccharolytica DSM 44247 = NBRC 16224]